MRVILYGSVLLRLWFSGRSMGFHPTWMYLLVPVLLYAGESTLGAFRSGFYSPRILKIGCVAADVILWKNKQTSASVLACATIIWLLFEWLGYYLLKLICRVLIPSITILFVWSNASTFINKQQCHWSVIHLRSMFRPISSVNKTLYVVGNLLKIKQSGRDLKKFFMVFASQISNPINKSIPSNPSVADNGGFS